MSKTLSGTVKEILGTAFSIGCTVNGESPKSISDKIAEGEIEIPVRMIFSEGTISNILVASGRVIDFVVYEIDTSSYILVVLKWNNHNLV